MAFNDIVQCVRYNPYLQLDLINIHTKDCRENAVTCQFTVARSLKVLQICIFLSLLLEEFLLSSFNVSCCLQTCVYISYPYSDIFMAQNLYQIYGFRLCGDLSALLPSECDGVEYQDR